MLVAKQDKELEFFKIFLERAINNETAYLDLVKPIILEVAKYAKGEIKLMDFSRESVPIKLKLCAFNKMKEVTSENLLLQEILNFLQDEKDY